MEIRFTHVSVLHAVSLFIIYESHANNTLKNKKYNNNNVYRKYFFTVIINTTVFLICNGIIFY